MAGGLVANRACMRVKAEAAYGAKEVLGATDVVLIRDFNPPKLQSELNERRKADTSLAPHSFKVGARHSTYGFTASMKGSGAAGTPPDIGPLLVALGMAETIVGATSVTYKPSSAYKGGVTAEFFQDGTRYDVIGGVGQGTFSWQSGGLFDFAGELTAFHQARADAAFPGTLTFESSDEVVALGVACTVGAYTGVVKGMQLQVENQIAKRKDANAASGYAGFLITARAWKGSVTMELDLAATKDWDAVHLAGTGQALSVVFNGGAGNILTLTAPNAMLEAPSPGEDEGVRTVEMPFRLFESALGANDEVSFAYT